MAKFCLNNTAAIIEHNGKLYDIEKPSIKKDFCFGFGMYGISTDDEQTTADNMAEVARTQADYFISGIS